MKILYITSSNGLTGSNIAVFHLVNLMHRKGHKTSVITATDSGPMPDKLRQLGCEVYQVDFRPNIYPVNHNPVFFLPRLAVMLLKNHRAKTKFKSIIKQFAPDLIHTNVGPINIAANVAHELHIPHVWHQREYIDVGLHFNIFPSHQTFLNETHRNGNYNICITEGVFKHSCFRNGIDRVIYDGVFPEVLTHEPPVKTKEKYVLYVGRICQIKGTLDLIKTFIRFHRKHPDYKLRLAGSYQMNEYTRTCFQMVESNHLQDDIEFLGERTDIYALMSKAAMLVVPSLCEGFGFITAEAMLNYCPVIGRDTGGTKEQFDIGHATTGQDIGFRFLDNEEMLDAMYRVAETDVWEMCERAHKIVSARYTVEQNAEQIEEYYQHILRGFSNV